MSEFTAQDLKDVQDKIKQISANVLMRRVIIFLIVIFVILLFTYRSFFVYIEPNEVGLKQINISLLGNQGLQEKKYYCGWHFKWPFLEEYIKFTNDIQVYELAEFRGSTQRNYLKKGRSAPRERETFFYDKLSEREVYAQKSLISAVIPEKKYQRQGAAKIQTNDGFYVDVDVTIIYRIIDPYKVATVLGRTPEEYRQNGIAKKAISVLKDSFGKLTTEEFYNSSMRVKKADDAKILFNEKVKSEGLEIEYVLVRYFEYSAEIQKNIEEKKLKDQLVFKNQSEARAAIEEAKLKKVKEEGEAALKVELQKGQAYVTRKNADKNAYVRKKRASGDLQVKLAEATKTRLINEAYRDKGAERIVGLEMAKVLEGIDVIIIPSDGKDGFNPLDLDKTIKLFESK